MDLNFLNPLRDRKAKLEQKLAEAKAAMIEVETALRLCDELATSLPAKIAAVQAGANYCPGVSTNWRSSADSLVGCDLIMREMNAVDALEALAKDLPDIRAFWEKRRRALAA